MLRDKVPLNSVGLPAKSLWSLTLEHNSLPVAFLLFFSEELVAGRGTGHEKPKFLQEMPQGVAHCQGVCVWGRRSSPNARGTRVMAAQRFMPSMPAPLAP